MQTTLGLFSAYHGGLILLNPKELSSEEMIKAITSKSGQGAGWGLFRNRLSCSGEFRKEGTPGQGRENMNEDPAGGNGRYHSSHFPPDPVLAPTL